MKKKKKKEKMLTHKKTLYEDPQKVPLGEAFSSLSQWLEDKIDTLGNISDNQQL